MFKLTHGVYDKEAAISFKRPESRYQLRGHNYKMEKERFRKSLRKNSFRNRVVTNWNSLPDSVVEAETLDTFKSRLDKHWRDQDVLYNYKASLTI